VGDGRLAAVADTGPLIHLAEIGCLPLLAIFDELHLPEGVWQEAQRPTSIHSELGRADRHTLPRAEVEEFAAKKGLQKLHGAERESLLLCSKLGVEVLLTDDLAVRQTPKALGLTPIGSLSVIVRAHRMGRITREEAEFHLRRLAAISSLFVIPAIVELAIDRLQGG
jgi:predicted nucleic acid-binding protein